MTSKQIQILRANKKYGKTFKQVLEGVIKENGNVITRSAKELKVSVSCLRAWINEYGVVYKSWNGKTTQQILKNFSHFGSDFKTVLQTALEYNDGHQSNAAKMLGVNQDTMSRWCEKYGLRDENLSATRTSSSFQEKRILLEFKADGDNLKTIVDTVLNRNGRMVAVAARELRVQKYTLRKWVRRYNLKTPNRQEIGRLMGLLRLGSPGHHHNNGGGRYGKVREDIIRRFSRYGSDLPTIMKNMHEKKRYKFAVIARKFGVSANTIYNWRQEFGID